MPNLMHSTAFGAAISPTEEFFLLLTMSIRPWRGLPSASSAPCANFLKGVFRLGRNVVNPPTQFGSVPHIAVSKHTNLNTRRYFLAAMLSWQKQQSNSRQMPELAPRSYW